ncbi:MAG: U32 family peptidase [Verrucomicrobiales bacterium]|nr:U32 family peptidase [Verrucomicrobiales bacterium]
MNELPAGIPAPTPNPTSPPPLPELLAPAGDWDCVRAAVENGADAVYFGLSRFNARMRAENFNDSELPELMAFLHRRGVRGYLTFNTLVFEDELAGAEQFLRGCIAAGVDAAIVQDVGICRLIRRLSPDFPIHASTQMTITSAAGVRFARELGCELVVLARECSTREIAALQQELGPASLPIEVFVHGALCVAYSGQCLTSESLGGRSANRGECAQACRLPYALIADGRAVDLGNRRYLLSPQDLMGLELLPELVRLGIASLKIEGRLKAPEYVANVTRAYREALDRVASQIAANESPVRIDAAPWRYSLEMAFSRGLYTGWFEGIDNQHLVHAEFGKKRGVRVGEVLEVRGNRVRMRLDSDLKPGDGIVFDAGTPDVREEGGRIYSVDFDGPDAWLGFGRDDVDLRRVRAGNRVWKTSDPALERQWRQSFAGDQPRFQRGLRMRVQGRAGEPLRLRVEGTAPREASGPPHRPAVAADGAHLWPGIELTSRVPLAVAEKRPLDTDRLSEQLGRLGDTPFRLETLVNDLEGKVILPVSELNRLRRAAVEQLLEQRSRPLRWTLHPESPGSQPEKARLPRPPDPPSPPDPSNAQANGPELVVLVRSIEQLEAAVAVGTRSVYCDFENPKAYREAVQRFRELTRSVPGAEIVVAPPRITKPGEGWIRRQIAGAEADGVLARHWDHLEHFQGVRRIGDFSLNIANHLAAAWFRERFGLERLTASYDLNNSQLEALLTAVPSHSLEIVIHQHMPMFHMEHCVFCAFLTEGRDYRDCGRPCEKQRVGLRDRVGAVHPVKADAGCRNTVFNALAQTGAEYVARLIDLGARWFRIEFLEESPETVGRTIQRYQALLRSEIHGADLWRELKLRHQLGVTRGSLDRGERPTTVL